MSAHISFICGKGGVGKSTLAAAFSMHHATQGGALCVSIDSPDFLSGLFHQPVPSMHPMQIQSGLWIVHLNQQPILNQFLAHNIKFGLLSRWILQHPLYPYISAIVPGIRELLVLEKIYEFSQSNFDSKWHQIFVDTPASGHILHLLRVPAGLRTLFKLGPLAKIISQVEKMLAHPDTKLLLTALPEEIPVQETIELIQKFSWNDGPKINQVILNRAILQNLPGSWSATLNKLTHLMTSQSLPISITQKKMIRNNLKLYESMATRTRKYKQLLHSCFNDQVTLIPEFFGENPSEIVAKIAESIP